MTFPIGFGAGTFGWKLVAASLHTAIAEWGLGVYAIEPGEVCNFTFVFI